MNTTPNVIYGITVDGSKSPKHVVKKGALVITRECKKPVVLVRTWAKHNIRLNTWAAFSTDPTTATGYSLARGVPTGRYLRPASDANCILIYRGDCNSPDIELDGPLFSRWDMRLKKRFPITGRVNIELMAEVLNVFDNINFNHGGPTNTARLGVNGTLNPDNGVDTFRVTSAYTDINTTFDPGGRIGQLVWRINW